MNDHDLLPKFYEDLARSVASKGWEELPPYPPPGNGNRQVLDLTLQRLALARFIHNDEFTSACDQRVGHNQDVALRLHLLLTCVETLGRAASSEPFLDFGSWLETKRKPDAGQRDDAIREVLGEPSSVAAMAGKAKAIHKAYKNTHGFRTNFYRFFACSIDTEMLARMVRECWIYKGPCTAPVAVPAELPITGGFGDRPECKKPVCTKDKEAERICRGMYNIGKGWRRWQSLDREARIRDIARALESMRNEFSHSLKPSWSNMDKNPFGYYGEQLLAALLAHQIRLLEDTDFSALSKDHRLCVREGVHYFVKEGVAFLRRSTAPDELDGWVDRQITFAKQLARHKEAEAMRPDSIYLHEHDMVFCVATKPITFLLEDMIENGLKNLVHECSR